jgi:hypothetical protein
MLPNAPRPIPFGQEKLRMSHVVDGLIGSMTHCNPYSQHSPIYGAPQYLKPHRGPYYYPPPTTNSHILLFPLSCWGDPHWYPRCIWSLNQVWVQPQPLHVTINIVEVLQLPILHMDQLPKPIHIFHFLVLHSQFCLHTDNHMSALNLFILLTFNSFILLNS